MPAVKQKRSEELREIDALLTQQCEHIAENEGLTFDRRVYVSNTLDPDFHISRKRNTVLLNASLGNSGLIDILPEVVRQTHRADTWVEPPTRVEALKRALECVPEDEPEHSVLQGILSDERFRERVRS